MSDWDLSEDETPVAPKVAPATTGTSTAPAIAPTPAPVAYKSRRFEGEDEEEEGDDDWDVSDSEKKKSNVASGASTPATAIKKKRNLKTVLAEKEAKAAMAKDQDDIMDDETPQERRRREKAQQEEAEAAAAADFLGAVSLGDAADLTKAEPKTKDDFIKLAQQVSAVIFERLHDRPLYSAFAEEIARMAVVPLKDVDTRKIGSAITAVASEKTKEAKDKASGKKKATKKPALGANKRVNEADTTAYDEALDDDLDFM